MRVYKEGNILDGAKPGCFECELAGAYFCETCSRRIFDKMRTPDGKLTCPKDPFTGRYVSVIFVFPPVNQVTRVIEIRAVHETELEPLDVIDIEAFNL